MLGKKSGGAFVALKKAMEIKSAQTSDASKTAIEASSDTSSKALQMLTYRGNTLRIITEDGVAWFAAIDIAKILGLGNIINLSRYLNAENTESAESIALKKRSMRVVDKKERTMVMLSQDGVFDILTAMPNFVPPLNIDPRDFKCDLEEIILPEIGVDINASSMSVASVMSAMATTSTMATVYDASATHDTDNTDDEDYESHEYTLSEDIPENTSLTNATLADTAYSTVIADITNPLSEFNYNGKTVRTITKDSEPWFIAKDVCDILDLSNVTKALRGLDDDELTLLKVRAGGQEREMNAINESGLYTLILRSNKPEAHTFRKWVTNTVLPSIRKYGIYATPETVKSILKNPDFIISLIKTVQSEQSKVAELETLLNANRHKIAFAEAVNVSDDCILVGTLAKFLSQNGVTFSNGAAGARAKKIGERNLFQWMRDNLFLMKAKGERWNLPTQNSINRGLFKIKEATLMCYEGSSEEARKPRVFRTPVITGKGQRYFIKLFFGDRAKELDMDVALRELREVERNANE